MKNLNFLSLLVIAALLFAVQPASAVVSVKNNQETATAAVSNKEMKKQQRMEKFMDKVQKKMEKLGKKGVDFSDPVDKWLWYAIVAGAIGLVLGILGWVFSPLWTVSGIAWTVAIILFIVWILKVTEVI